VSQGRAAADELEKAILREGADTVAAFLAEPVQGAGGLMVPQDDYFPRIREICDKYDVLFMADEVITGFGRLGKWFGLSHWNVEPDIISFAKGITSGYLPLGGIGISDKVFKALVDTPPERRWMHAFTYSAHPTCCAVALATLDILEREGLIEEAGRKGKRLLAGLRQLASLDNVGDVRGLGLMCGVELVEDKPTKARFPAARKVGARLYQECAKRGLVSRIKDDIYMLAPAFVISDDDIDRCVNIIGESIPVAVRS
jgi:adenosylmethionine-8-amino-7-oxononanoate aminotransferase